MVILWLYIVPAAEQDCAINPAFLAANVLILGSCHPGSLLIANVLALESCHPGSLLDDVKRRYALSIVPSRSVDCYRCHAALDVVVVGD